LTRVVAAPSDASALESDAAMLAGNLGREQVEALLPPPAPVAPVLVAPPPSPEPQAPAPPERWAATVGLFYPLATHHGHAEVTSSFDLNLLYSRVGSIDGAQLGGVNVVGREHAAASMRGLQLGAFVNLVDGDARGVQLAGLFNQVSAGTDGAQLALGANLTDGAARGVQGALLFNRAGSMEGLQVSAVNVAGDVDGVQIGLVNVLAGKAGSCGSSTASSIPSPLKSRT
jgi:hypothetical protein